MTPAHRQHRGREEAHELARQCLEYPAEQDAERLTRFVIERLYQQHGVRWLQRKRPTPLPNRAKSPLAETLAQYQLFAVAEPPSTALLGWLNGERPAFLLRHAPSEREILAIQAKGARYVSLLRDDEAGPLHKDALGFALHDLCHLEKFVDPAHYHGQVAFFRRCERVLAEPRWQALVEGFDDVWQHGFHRVISDMNGSAVFLWAALKANLRGAVLRLHRDKSEDAQQKLVAEAEAMLIACMGFEGELAVAAQAIHSRANEGSPQHLFLASLLRASPCAVT
jgi:hypothetical protein